MKICNLASGSKGNCTWVSNNGTNVLIDDGISLRELKKRIEGASLDLDLRKLNAIVITHEHSDHIKGLKMLSKTYNIPVYIHAKSLQYIFDEEILKNVVDQNMDKPFDIGELHITPFRLPHDSAYNLGYKFDDGKNQFSIATDLGYVSDSTLENLKGSKMVMLEANHDLQMLRNGPYPAYLKHRIESKNGHLCNEDSANTSTNLCKSGTE